ncbi:MerR family transcriptional regulator [Paeniroseomonas aquatica]|uniref:MerR family transcriptional regulator n=1 Tax=Paeniroseomonas aquatica TaxID=373043 RepID=UPI003620779D
MPSNGPASKPDAEAAALEPAYSTSFKEIPAAVFAALVGRTLRTLRNWDEAGLTHPEMRNSRRYYGATDLAAVVASGLGRRGPREGSAIRHLSMNGIKAPK